MRSINALHQAASTHLYHTQLNAFLPFGLSLLVVWVQKLKDEQPSLHTAVKIRQDATYEKTLDTNSEHESFMV